jgi:hypothetical protein
MTNKIQKIQTPINCIKKIILVSILIISPQISSALEGFYGGVILGNHEGTVDARYVSNNNKHNNDLEGKSLGLKLGYLKPMNSFITGAEISFEDHNKTQSVGDCPNSSYQCKTKINSTMALKTKIGYQLQNSPVVPMLFVGITESKVMVQERLKSGLLQFPGESNVNGILYGLELNSFLNDKTILGASYTWHEFNHTSIRSPEPENIKTKIKYETIGFSLSYLF